MVSTLCAGDSTVKVNQLLHQSANVIVRLRESIILIILYSVGNTCLVCRQCYKLTFIFPDQTVRGRVQENMKHRLEKASVISVERIERTSLRTPSEHDRTDDKILA